MTGRCKTKLDQFKMHMYYLLGSIIYYQVDYLR